jgi:hypothetical protein
MESMGDAGGGPADVDSTKTMARIEKWNKLLQRIDNPPDIERGL